MSAKGVLWLVGLECGKKGPQLRAYLDGKGGKTGVPTIGVGQTTLMAQGGERRVTLADWFPDVDTAIASFRKRLKRDEAAVDAVTRDDITQAEFDAFCAARYNIGPNFDSAQFVRLFNLRAPLERVTDSLRANWHRSGETPHVLDERRQCEADLLLYGCYRVQGEKRS
jgi:GH24 family phage-related lysozyme (muramidase)